MITLTSIFIKTPCLCGCQPRLKRDTPVHEIKTIPHQASNWKMLIKKIPCIMKIFLVFLVAFTSASIKNKINCFSAVNKTQVLDNKN